MKDREFSALAVSSSLRSGTVGGKRLPDAFPQHPR